MNWTNTIVLRYFISRKKDAFVNLTSKIATFAISFSIAMLIIAFGVIRGFEESIFNKVLQDQGHLAIMDYYTFEAKEVTKKIPPSLTYKQVVETHGMLAANFRTENVLIRGVEKSEIEKLQPIQADSRNIGEGYNVYVGHKLAKNMNLSIGDKISLILPMFKEFSPFSIKLELIECHVADIVKFGMHDLNRLGIYLELSQAQKMLDLDEKVSKIICFAKTPKEALKTARALQATLPLQKIFTWQDLNMLFADIMRIQRNMVCVILFAIIFLAITTSIASLILFINMKKREISVLIVLGAKKRQISYIFIKLAALLAATSSFIGTLIGIFLAYNIDHIRKFIEWLAGASLFDPEIYLLPAIPVSIHAFDIAMILIINFLIAVLASVWPAYKSASINVLENIN